MRHHGFSLIELLVVIVIIAVLAGMLLPAVQMVRDAARSAVCQSSLRQLSIGVQGYAAEWDGAVAPTVMPQAPTFVSDFRWFLLIAPYVVKDGGTHASLQSGNTVIWGCPIWAKERGKQIASGTSSTPGYGMNGNLGAPDASWNTNFTSAGAKIVYFAQVTLKTQRALLGDSMQAGLGTEVVGGKTIWHNSDQEPMSWSSSSDPRRHRGRANYAFVDGHIQNLAPGGNSPMCVADPSKFDL